MNRPDEGRRVQDPTCCWPKGRHCWGGSGRSDIPSSCLGNWYFHGDPSSRIQRRGFQTGPGRVGRGQGRLGRREGVLPAVLCKARGQVLAL